MNAEDIVAQLVSEIDAATASDVDVRTIGGDDDVTPPDIILDWTVSRIPDANGHTPHGGYIEDGSGNKTGVEHHTYWSFEADCTARSYNEQARDQFLRDIQDAFVVYEGSPAEFDRDTRSWEIGSSGPRENSVIEPDWYEAGILIGFEYMRRTDETGRDHIETVNDSVEVNESLEATTTETN